ncbi:hypothetical protein [Aurantiacibacter poecillastricola]|uniref:hypothetical protein n=1 Tax=Aurantiacibacter poecillastricola TaxID=3064385 RepID=UPI00273F8E30|nr:hypothetical protein [Aurantiacibacter sp. 219JJ12-13]MDP5262729.1 hypothetical protein [Aurantiacibacter sp. 219JJ12-13]
MRRALVLTTESSRHPFRASLPPHVLRRANEVEPMAPWRKRLSLGLSRQDLETMAATYAAGFLATLSFFA